LAHKYKPDKSGWRQAKERQRNPNVRNVGVPNYGSNYGEAWIHTQMEAIENIPLAFKSKSRPVTSSSPSSGHDSSVVRSPSLSGKEGAVQTSKKSHPTRGRAAIVLQAPSERYPVARMNATLSFFRPKLASLIGPASGERRGFVVWWQTDLVACDTADRHRRSDRANINLPMAEG
jgi:hypothetical protein